jgi:hypothetical protein
MWNVRSFYTAGSFLTVAKEMSQYKLHLMGVQEVKWAEVAPNKQANMHFL